MRCKTLVIRSLGSSILILKRISCRPALARANAVLRSNGSPAVYKRL